MKIATIVGARPQFIKAAVVSRVIRDTDGIDEKLIHTGQHFDTNMSDVFFDELDIRMPDYNLGIGGGTHGQNTGRMIEAIENVLIELRPEKVLVYGDTDSTLAGALAAAKLHIPIAHVESGLRSFNRRMPEEINRVLTDHAADLLFAPTDTSVLNLRNEGIDAGKVYQVGDVMYDATLFYCNRTRRPPSFEGFSENFVLCTIHRAENTDDILRLNRILDALSTISSEYTVILPIHPRTAGVIKKMPQTKKNSNFKIIEPMGFLEMQWLLQHCKVVITDSGGVQKEAYFHQKPCVTIRDETEWVELIRLGVNKLAPPLANNNILDCFYSMLNKTIQNDHSLYGKGDAGWQIVGLLSNE
ncbi:MAG: UDP-N-acetylglucosamine 2-epimerase (non-hydrolyzing) [Bacteroidales bacterium]|jgi:UDP-GlcNAc3NAcA epimerase